MESKLDIFERFFRAAVVDLPAVAACIGTKACNQTAPQGTAFPYAVFNVIPLQDKQGQARTSILTRFLVDLKFVSNLPLPASVGQAVAAVEEHFRTSHTFDSENCRISIWHKSPINFLERGTIADEKILIRGCTFEANIARITAG